MRMQPELTTDTLTPPGSADLAVVSTPRKVMNAGDRVFYLVVRGIAISVILLALLLVADLVRGSWESIQQFGIGFLFGTTWDPVRREFSTLPTIIGTLVKGFIALLL